MLLYCCVAVTALSFLDADEKKEYCMARDLAPHLFQEEVNPINFLRTCNFDPWATAERLVHYWKQRKITFQDKWLLPLALAAYGAMKLPIDLELMQSAYSVTYDDFAIIDFSRLTDFVGTTNYSDQELEDSRMRLMFYHMTVTSSSHARRHGKKILCAVEGITVGRLCKTGGNWFPSKVEKNPSRATQSSILAFHHKLLVTSAGCATPVCIFTSSKREMFRQLVEAGFPPEIIPKTFGGPWSYTRQVEEWIAWRMRRDDERNQRVLLKTTKTTTNNNNINSKHNSKNNIATRVVSPPMHMPLQNVDYRMSR